MNLKGFLEVHLQWRKLWIFFKYLIIPSEINPSIGIGPTQGQRKTLTRVGSHPGQRFSTESITTVCIHRFKVHSQKKILYTISTLLTVVLAVCLKPSYWLLNPLDWWISSTVLPHFFFVRGGVKKLSTRYLCRGIASPWHKRLAVGREW